MLRQGVEHLASRLKWINDPECECACAIVYAAIAQYDNVECEGLNVYDLYHAVWDHLSRALNSRQYPGYQEMETKEILESNPPRFLRTGVITKATYEAWDGNSASDVSSTYIGGPGVVIHGPSEVWGATTHVKVEWLENTDEDFADFIAEIKRLQELNGDVRFVFGFDS